MSTKVISDDMFLKETFDDDFLIDLGWSKITVADYKKLYGEKAWNDALKGFERLSKKLIKKTENTEKK